MTSHRTHYATTNDGVTIGGTVHGRGPALVFVQGVVGDGDLDWGSVLEHLTDSYTCYLPSLRCRGLSDESTDLRTSRTIEDLATFVDSVGEPVGLVGWSGGGYFALGVAQMRPDAVTAVAPIEPGILTLMDDAERTAVGGAVGAAAELAAAGELAGALRAFLGWPFTDDDVAGAEDAGYVEACARYVPQLLSTLQQAMEEGYDAVQDPAALGAIDVPVLVIRGTETKPFMTTCSQFVVDHVPHARMREIPGAGHAAPVTHPEALAHALAEFFAPAPQPV